jgi:hypothetical protein
LSARCRFRDDDDADDDDDDDDDGCCPVAATATADVESAGVTAPAKNRTIVDYDVQDMALHMRVSEKVSKAIIHRLELV